LETVVVIIHSNLLCSSFPLVQLNPTVVFLLSTTTTRTAVLTIVSHTVWSTLDNNAPITHTVLSMLDNNRPMTVHYCKHAAAVYTLQDTSVTHLHTTSQTGWQSWVLTSHSTQDRSFWRRRSLQPICRLVVNNSECDQLPHSRLTVDVNTAHTVDVNSTATRHAAHDQQCSCQHAPVLINISNFCCVVLNSNYTALDKASVITVNCHVKSLFSPLTTDLVTTHHSPAITDHSLTTDQSLDPSQRVSEVKYSLHDTTQATRKPLSGKTNQMSIMLSWSLL